MKIGKQQGWKLTLAYKSIDDNSINFFNFSSSSSILCLKFIAGQFVYEYSKLNQGSKVNFFHKDGLIAFLLKGFSKITVFLEKDIMTASNLVGLVEFLNRPG
jgi:hypothetical protein